MGELAGYGQAHSVISGRGSCGTPTVLCRIKEIISLLQYSISGRLNLAQRKYLVTALVVLIVFSIV